MMFIDKILTWARNNGISAIYGSPEQVNAMMQNTDFSSSDGGTVMYCHLITDSETTDGRDTAAVAVYFCRLCDLDFNGENLLPVQSELKDTGKQLLLYIERGNEMAYDGVRWQYGYDDYAENVAWVCLRVTLTALSADCFGRQEPDIKNWIKFTSRQDGSRLEIGYNSESPTTTIDVSRDGKNWSEENLIIDETWDRYEMVMNDGESVWLRRHGSNYDDSITISCIGAIECEGDIYALRSKNMDEWDVIRKNYLWNDGFLNIPDMSASVLLGGDEYGYYFSELLGFTNCPVSDDGETFNFIIGVTAEQLYDAGQIDEPTNKAMAEYLGNSNGFN